MYYINLSHWGLFPISDTEAASLIRLGTCLILDGYILIPFRKG